MDSIKISGFKTYDIRGEYGVDFDAVTVYHVGRHLPGLLNAYRVLIGHDARESSAEIRDALARGLTEAGADVDCMDLATTPMVYHFTAARGYDASVQITASHNPAHHNGMKISSKGAVPVGAESGLPELAARVAANRLPPLAAQPGRFQKVEALEDFIRFLDTWKTDFSNLRFAVDCSDGVSSLVARRLFGDGTIYFNDTPDGRFPHHPPNPLEVENCHQLMEVVKKNKLDLGMIFDGDGDRVMFVDEHGEFVQPDYLIPILADYFLRAHPGEPVVHDIRTSRGVIETLRDMGAQPVMWKVGHSFAKKKMRETAAICGGELAGHYYFRDFHWCDSAELAALIILGEVARAKARGLSFSQFLAPIRRYATTGEVNFTISRKDEAIDTLTRAILRRSGEPLARMDFDGVRIEYKDWWVSLRKSNTESFVRLIVEATTPELLAELRAEFEAVLKPFVAQ